MAKISVDCHLVLLTSLLAVVSCHSNTPPFPDQQQHHIHHQGQQQIQQPGQVNQQQGQQHFDQQQHIPVQDGQHQQFQPEQVQQFNPDLNQQGQPRQHAPQGHRFHDPNHIQDREHIMEHYDGVANTKEKMTPDEMQFHYFKVHDYDNNNMLDGIELISALTHFHKEDGNEAEDGINEGEISELIDEIMKEDDLNDDGYIDYAEFVNSQQRADEESNKEPEKL